MELEFEREQAKCDMCGDVHDSHWIPPKDKNEAVANCLRQMETGNKDGYMTCPNCGNISLHEKVEEGRTTEIINLKTGKKK